MSEDLHIDHTLSRGEAYAALIPQIKALIGQDREVVSVLANVAAAIHQSFDFLWIGFYLVKGNVLTLGPFQGPVACMRIEKGKGVCGSSWELAKTIIVPDVQKFPGHIACSSLSRSEIVVPVLNRESVVKAVLDIDSAKMGDFDQTDQEHLEKLCSYIGEHVF